MTAYLSSVPFAELDTLTPKFLDALGRIANKDGIDMERMKSLLDRQKLQLLESMETDASDVLCNVVVSDGIWGKADGSDFKGSLKVKAQYKELDGWTAKDWAALLKKCAVFSTSSSHFAHCPLCRFFVNAPALTLIGKPSAALAKKIKEDAKALVDANVAKYGPEGLAKLQKEIEDAQAENDRPVPPEIIREFKVRFPSFLP